MNGVDIGNAIKVGRVRRGLTQKALAEILGVNQQTIFCWEKNKYVPDGNMLLHIAMELDIVSELLPGYKKIGRKEESMEERLNRLEKAVDRLSGGDKTYNLDKVRRFAIADPGVVYTCGTCGKEKREEKK